ncbi:uncharacterized protein J3D65DRAFT_627118 [Phyllosticta citribraziliensis]|uniref:Transcription initiation factor IIA subunit 2 n=1 Tax=Phyllosticta citribraziliensis TaxID=989973 RepID=A0ABR1LLE3_9PEZI
MANLSAGQHYRQTTIGQTLIEALDGLVQEHRMEPQLGAAVIQHLDRIMAEVFRENERLRRKRLKFKARCLTYRFIDDRWFWLLRGATFTTDSGRKMASEGVRVHAVAAEPKVTAAWEEDDELHRKGQARKKARK